MPDYTHISHIYQSTRRADCPLPLTPLATPGSPTTACSRLVSRTKVQTVNHAAARLYSTNQCMKQLAGMRTLSTAHAQNCLTSHQIADALFNHYQLLSQFDRGRLLDGFSGFTGRSGGLGSDGGCIESEAEVLPTAVVWSSSKSSQIAK